MDNMENKDVVETVETQAAPVATDDGKRLSIAALVLGILGIVGGTVLSFVPFIGVITFVCAILGIVFGAKGRGMSVAVNGKASGLATAGLVLGIIGTAFGAIGVVCGACSAAICAAAAAAA